MEYLMLQTGLFLLLATLVGVGLGWLGTRFIYTNTLTSCQHELTGLRRNYEDASRENATLRTRLKQLETALQRFGTQPETDYGEFLQTRKALENIRCQYEVLLEKFHQQASRVQQVQVELRNRQTELETLKRALAEKAAHQDALETISLTPAVVALALSDDLTCIQGITQVIAAKLRALGIMTCRQIAELTRDDICSVQRILGTDEHLPIDEWVQNARKLVPPPSFSH